MRSLSGGCQVLVKSRNADASHSNRAAIAITQ